MKTVILCGGRGTRLGEHGASVPKGLIEIGGRPILWHLLKLYSHYGLNDFVLCLGYLGDSIRRYFLEQRWLSTDFTLEMTGSGEDRIIPHEVNSDNWSITFAGTGLDTNTGGRILRIAPYLDGEENFCVTYGDGLSNVDLRRLIEFHQGHGRIATLCAVRPNSSFGVIQLGPDGEVRQFEEKPVMSDWINGGFFIFNRRILDYLTLESVLEREPLRQLAAEGELIAYRHDGFWKCMDTYKDNLEFNQLWERGDAPWRVWEQPVSGQS
ncbi:MAG: glucose-1-phosphate cytidylyltransferase [Blastocatellia bacterium]|jgi:glucose-1-phosphate cytidylyltransferase